MRVEIGSIAFLMAAGSGYLIGLDDGGHQVEAPGDWRASERCGTCSSGPSNRMASSGATRRGSA